MKILAYLIFQENWMFLIYEYTRAERISCFLKPIYSRGNIYYIFIYALCASLILLCMKDLLCALSLTSLCNKKNQRYERQAKTSTHREFVLEIIKTLWTFRTVYTLFQLPKLVPYLSLSTAWYINGWRCWREI